MNVRLLLRKIRFVYSTISISLYNAGKYIKYSNGFFSNNTEKKLIDYIIVMYHPIEKGLCMPNFHLGFAQERIIQVIELCNKYRKTYKKDCSVTKEVAGVIKEYYNIHKKNNFIFSKEFIEIVEKYLESYKNVLPAKQFSYTYDEFYSHNNEEWPIFLKSRRSIRNYDPNKDISKETIQTIIQEVLMSPSTCNRQSIKLHFVIEKEKVKK